MADITWTVKTSLPLPNRYGPSGCAMGNDSAYQCGGYSPPSNDHDQYSSANDAWTAKANMPANTTEAGSSKITEDKTQHICLIKSTDNYVYSDYSNSFTTRNDMSGSSRQETMPANESNDYTYTAGGDEASGHTTDHYEWYRVTEVWTSKTALTAPGRQEHEAEGYPAGEKIYIIFGEDSTPTNLRDIDEYDASGNSWSNKTDSPAPGRKDSSCRLLDASIYGVGGQNGGVGDHTDRYDITGNSWTATTSRPIANYLSGSGAVSSKLAYFYAGLSSYLANYEIEKRVPQTEFRSFDITGSEPSDRTSEGTSHDDSDDPLNFGSVAQNGDSPVKVWVGRLLETGFTLTDMSIFLNSEDFEAEDTQIYIDITDTWTTDKTPQNVKDGTPGEIPEVQPETPNITKIGGGDISGTGHADTTQYVYTVVWISSAETTVGHEFFIRWAFQYY